MTYYDHAAFEAHEKVMGHPAEDLPLVVREAYAIAGEPVPQNRRRMLSVHTPWYVGLNDEPRCCHCGTPVPPKQHLAAHAVAGFEDAHEVTSGNLLRMLVVHCDRCSGSDFCKRDEVSPNAGWAASPTAGHLVGPGGFCEPVEHIEELGMVIIPGARYLARWAGWALSAIGLYFLSNGIVTSQGQQVANLGGPLSSLIVPGTATAGQGFNVGGLRVLSGAAPGTGASAANAAETGTLLINWAMPATAFAAPSAATPSVATANAIANVTAAATGTAGYARLVEQADTFGLSTAFRRFQLTVGTSAAELIFNTLSISAGGTCSCTSFTIAHGA